MSTHDLFLNTDMKSIDFLFSIYLNKRVFVFLRHESRNKGMKHS